MTEQEREIEARDDMSVNEAWVAEAYRRYPDVIEPVDYHPAGKIVVDNGNLRYAFLMGAEFAAAPQPASPLGAREAIARIIHPVGFDEDSMERLSVVAAHRKEAFAKADAILAAIPQERGVERSSVRRAIKAAESAGLRVTGITAAGTVLTAPAGEVAAEPAEDPFVLGARRLGNNS